MLPGSESFILTDDERDLMRWAKNSSAISAPRGMDSLVYKKATALEVLVAVLHLTCPDRCQQLIINIIDYDHEVL